MLLSYYYHRDYQKEGEWKDVQTWLELEVYFKHSQTDNMTAINYKNYCSCMNTTTLFTSNHTKNSKK